MASLPQRTLFMHFCKVVGQKKKAREKWEKVLKNFLDEGLTRCYNSKLRW